MDLQASFSQPKASSPARSAGRAVQTGPGHCDSPKPTLFILPILLTLSFFSVALWCVSFFAFCTLSGPVKQKSIHRAARFFLGS